MQTNIIYNSDCLEIMKAMPDNSVDLVVTSPPYDNLRTYNNSSKWNFDIFKSIANELYRILKNGGVVVWIVGDATINGSESGTSFKQALFFKELGFNLHDTMIYHKTNAPLSHPRYEQEFEYMFIFCKGEIKKFNGIKDKKNKYAGDVVGGTKRDCKTDKTRQLSGNKKGKLINEYGLRGNVWYIPNRGNRSGHPAVFPLQLAIDHIVSWSDENDIVFDPFLGSGTTAIACLNLNRRYIGCEIDKEYFDIATKRIETVKKINKSKLF